jgi:hypothetical protein
VAKEYVRELVERYIDDDARFGAAVGADAAHLMRARWSQDAVEDLARSGAGKPFPPRPRPLALYLTELARDHHVSTLTRCLVALAAAHHAAGYDSPDSAPGVRTLLAGICRVKGTAPATQKKPLLVADLERMENRSQTFQGLGPFPKSRLPFPFSDNIIRSIWGRNELKRVTVHSFKGDPAVWARSCPWCPEAWQRLSAGISARLS